MTDPILSRWQMTLAGGRVVRKPDEESRVVWHVDKHDDGFFYWHIGQFEKDGSFTRLSSYFGPFRYWAAAAADCETVHKQGGDKSMTPTPNPSPAPRSDPASLDLAAIRERLYERERPVISPWTYQQRLLWSEPLDEAIRADVRALVSEVERLRIENAYLFKWLSEEEQINFRKEFGYHD